jgi:hypothetical protein
LTDSHLAEKHLIDTII